LSSQASLYLGDEAYQHPDYEKTLQTPYECPATPEELERFEPPCVSCWCNSRTKRWFDVGLALPTLVLTSPLLVGIAIAIKLTSRGPVLFRQPRVGRNQVPFIILKFRTMAHSLGQNGPSVTRHGDPRLTFGAAFCGARNWMSCRSCSTCSAAI
jgi:lipopolysaccharide/colanic/teichoic acid biosynthesis glycosyltransferase